MSLTLWHLISLIGFLSRNRARGEKRWRQRCRWGMMWRTCAAMVEHSLRPVGVRVAELHRVASSGLLVDLGVDVVLSASTSWVCASDPVTRYLSHNSTSHPAKNAKVCKSFSPVLPGWGQEDRVYPGRRFTEKSVSFTENQSIYLQITFISLMRTKAN